MTNPNLLPNAPIPPVADFEVEEFYRLPINTQLKLGKAISAIYRRSVDDYLARSHARWVTISVPDGEILDSGKDIHMVPSRVDVLEDLARKGVFVGLPSTFVGTSQGEPSINIVDSGPSYEEIQEWTDTVV